MKKILVIIIVLGGLAYGGYRWWSQRSATGKEQAVSYRTLPIMRSSIVQEVTATGTVAPIKKVEVATQVTGKVLELLADYNSHVRAGEKIATIDPATYEAALASSQARLKSSLASLARTKVELNLAEKELLRQQKLAERKMNTEAELDSALAARDQLLAQIKSNEASIEEAEASTRQAKANLNYCTINSPVTGVVISRSVDEGQTVVSNMNASALFTIATDLSKMQVEASIPEADIGQIKVGQTVNFTVDAYKDNFVGKVTQIRLAATTVSNVVTYPVIVEAENPGEKLFPGMTANLSIIVEEARNILTVPAAALRFKPADPSASAGKAPGGGMPSGAPPAGFQRPAGMAGGFSGGFPAGGMGKSAAPAGSGSVIWLLGEDGKPQKAEVKLGITDGVQQEIKEAESLEGKAVIIGIQKAVKQNTASAGSSNPFTPKFPGANKKNNSRGGSGAPAGPPR